MSKTRKKSKTSVKKKAVKKPAARRAKPAKRKAVKKVTIKVPRSSSSAIDTVADSALKLVDQAASLLRSGIRTSANQTEKARLESKKRALSLVNQASGHLSKALDQGSGTIRNILSRI